MNRHCHKISTALLLGGYAFTTLFGGAFHTHRGLASCLAEANGDCGNSACHLNHVHSTPGNPSQGLKGPVLQADLVSSPSHCLICSFLSQKPAPPEVYSIEHSEQLRQPLVRLRAIPPSDDIPTTVFGRGPPAIA